MQDPAVGVLIEMSARIVANGEALAEIWPGFWPEDQPFLLYIPGHAATLVFDAEPPPRFVAPGALPSELRGRLYVYPGTPPGLAGTYVLEYPAGPVRVTAAVLDPDSVLDGLETLFHESFHVFQKGTFAPDTLHGQYIDPAEVTSARYAALVELERQALREALQAPNDSIARERARRYLALRRARLEDVSSRARETERELERVEGSTQLVGTEAALVLNDSPAAVPKRILAVLERPLADCRAAQSSVWFGGGFTAPAPPAGFPRESAPNR